MGGKIMKFSISKAAVLGVVLISVLVLTVSPAIAAKKPNIVLVFMDNFGWGEIGAYGGGMTELKFNFIKPKEFGGTGELYVNGKKVDEIDMPRMHISTYSLAETFDVGRDTGTQVSKLYTDPFPFKGVLDRVTITLTD
jgi:hypothetical protein